MDISAVDVMVVLGCQADTDPGRTESSLERALGIDAGMRGPLEWLRVKCLHQDPVVLRALKTLEADGLVVEHAGLWSATSEGRTVGRRIHDASTTRLSTW